MSKLEGEWLNVRLQAKHVEPILQGIRAGKRIQDIGKGEKILDTRHLTVAEFITAMQAARKQRKGRLPFKLARAIRIMVAVIFQEFYNFNDEAIKALWEDIGLKP